MVAALGIGVGTKGRPLKVAMRQRERSREGARSGTRRWREETRPSCASRWKEMASSRLRHGRTRAGTEPTAGAAGNGGGGRREEAP